MTRADELAAGLAAVEERVARACEAAGRDRSELLLVAVSKTWPASDVVAVAGLGVHDFGEARDSEAVAKAAEVASATQAPPRWHHVGRVQSNKAAAVASYADVVHALDRARLARALSDGAERAAREVEVLVQVSLDGDPQRGGAVIADVPALASLAADLPGLRLGGVMAVAPREGDPARAFALLAEVAEALRADHPQATTVSAGMSGDLEQAVAAGATCLRVGTALFGHRPPING